ncbi:uncharacterized protein CANTADRAFT_24643 [Suhomyces tanzawaensis NRRL Y-17324]|uniref:Peroxin 20 n=1 Tax=Suhomyces tanzawaensis NRRL Y-17324 TaxID=984487 RepID=A0A1E4SQX5_9ASCO|nr:uncharacterized protein CANTADRAFT_24643 [Suhomyces tanzawaensis NRRL Y-17324]ODV81901.1 hypothetical protein CANTADRAFT_24643 [Suhomyces tanzawaensis NRRL Y-17324]
MEASCGPSNAVSKLTQHSNRDNSLQHEFRARNHPGQGPQSFRQGQAVDAHLNHEFQQFNSGNDFASSFMRSGGYNVPHVQHQHQHHQPAQASQNTHWVQDFAGLSIQNKPQQNDWHHQFMQSNNMQTKHHEQSQAHAQYDMGQAQYSSGPRFQMNMRTNLSTPLYAQQPAEQVLQQHKQQQHDFDSQFDLLEKELEAQQLRAANETVTGELATIADNDLEKEQFAKTAQQVEMSMKASQSANTDMNNKIQNSQFLKLMSSIGARQVELEGDKLVDASSRQDVRDTELADPVTATSHHKTCQHETCTDETCHHEASHDQPSHHHSLHQHIPHTGPIRTHQDPAHENKLPDPLAHIMDGALGDISEPLLAAQVVSGNQVQSGDWMEDDMWSAPVRKPKNSILSPEWQEVFEDYRNDDDFH